ncbi:MAG: hypothetical protein HY720_15435 [Planctomycetes bacterium]|nr:hypothetical protein [Planctomycetota bacterium]
MLRNLVVAAVLLAACFVAAACQSDIYAYHHGAHGHYDEGVTSTHNVHHYGNFAHPYGQHGWSD